MQARVALRSAVEIGVPVRLFSVDIGGQPRRHIAALDATVNTNNATASRLVDYFRHGRCAFLSPDDKLQPALRTGLYFARLQFGPRLATHKLMVLR